MAVTGGEIVAEMLSKEGVDTVFGIIDGTYTALLTNIVSRNIKLITPRHETTALHMGGAYARLTGKLGVCIASNGPGVANALSGVAVENAEGNRILFITSSRRPQISNPDRGGAYQYLDHVGIIKGMSKWSTTISTAERIPELMREALRKCYEGRPGIVHIDIPETVFNGEASPVNYQTPGQYRVMDPVSPSESLVDQAAEMLLSARLPVIHAGSSIIHAMAFDELAELAHLMSMPVTTSWAARSVFPESDPLAWSMIHVKSVTTLRNTSDLVLCLGSRLGETDWWGKAPYWASPDKQKFIQVDIDPGVIGRNHPVNLSVIADVKEFLQKVIAKLKSESTRINLKARNAEIAKLHKEIEKDRTKLDEKLKDLSSPLLTAHVPKTCQNLVKKDTIVVFDGGNTSVWGNFFYKFDIPNTFLATNHMGHLGAGVGQALGAAAAYPDRQVLCIIGDGAMGFHPQEIETAIRNNLNVIFLVVADKQWGMVKLTQSMALKPAKMMLKKILDPKETINTELSEIKWDKMAQAMGAHGERVSSPEELKSALTRSLTKGICSIIHVDVDPVKHLWAPGLLNFKAMHQEPKGK